MDNTPSIAGKEYEEVDQKITNIPLTCDHRDSILEEWKRVGDKREAGKWHCKCFVIFFKRVSCELTYMNFYIFLWLWFLLSVQLKQQLEITKEI